MTRVLFIAYFFPPAGGSGVQRTVKFARYLPEFGMTPAIVTGPAASDHLGVPTDRSLGDEVAADVEVLRVAGPEPADGSRWRRRAERWLRRRSAWSSWWINGVARLAPRLPETDVIVASGSPFESFEAAQRVSEGLGIPWIADLRDPWVLDEMRIYQSALHRRLELRAMRRSLRTAGAVIMNTPEAALRLRRAFPEWRHGAVHAIPNGFDAADFAGPPPARDPSRFRIVHVGTLHTAQGSEHRRSRLARRLLGGLLEDVDILTRSHVYLMQAVECLIAEEPGLAEIVQIDLAGDLTPEDVSAIDLDVVRNHGYLAHADSLALMRSADLLFLPMHDLPPGRRAGLVPGKTYEYLAARRPILAAVPDGDARDLISGIAGAYVCRPRDVDGIAAAIRAELGRWRADETGYDPASAVVAAYERRELTGRLAVVIRDVLGSAG